MSSRTRLRHALWGSLAATLSLAHCTEGGLNLNEQMAGNGDNGVDVGFGEIAIDPTGSYLVSRNQEALVYGDLATTEVRTLRGLGEVERVAFANTRRELFATRHDSETRGKLFRYDLTGDKSLWALPIEVDLAWDTSGFGTRPWIDVLEDDSKLVLTFQEHIEIVDAASGVRLFSTPRAGSIVDVDITPDQKRLVVTHDHEWNGDAVNTRIDVYDLNTYEKTIINVPNCADELVITPDGARAFLAPTTCQRDPISVIDLATARFERNLPGFGPVALAPDGQLAVGFLDTDNLDADLFDDPAQIPDESADQYHVMLIDSKTLKFELVELGDTLPRYAVSPDGKLLLVDADSFWEDGRIRLLDVKARTLAAVKGPDLRLESYVVTRDSQRVFLLDHGLFEIELDTRAAQAELLEFTPDNLNITPDDSTLVLRQDMNTLWLYDVQSGKLTRSLELEEPSLY